MPTDPYFHMHVKDVFSIGGKGIVVTGPIEKGTLRAGDEILIRGGPADRKAVVVGIEAARKTIEEAKTGDSVGILLKDLKRADVERGFELMSPDWAK